jgi:uncharacterized protein YqjF (DUF2071 family)
VPRPFLTARWANLFLANYAVPASLLEPRLPPGLALDTRDGSPYVSLVAFQFLDTRVLGVPWPGYRHFPEVNLRFYVRDGDERGVVFIREFVPHRLTAWLARVLYNEPYLAAPMSAKIGRRADGVGEVQAEYRLHHSGRWNTFSVTGVLPAMVPSEGSVEHFFKEERYGFGTTRKGDLLRYEVAHPIWSVYPVREYRVDLDWGGVYGQDWAFLEGREPQSTVFAVGSAITVSPKVIGRPAPALLPA